MIDLAECIEMAVTPAVDLTIHPEATTSSGDVLLTRKTRERGAARQADAGH
jgi:hypothetical protein